jgi:hypothetical protein
MGLSPPTETPPDRRRGGQSFGIPGWAGDESISRNPSGVPILDSFTADGAFKAADLACLCNVFAAVINRAALTSSMGTDHRTSSPPHSFGPSADGPEAASVGTPDRGGGTTGVVCQPRFLHSGESS